MKGISQLKGSKQPWYGEKLVLILWIKKPPEFHVVPWVSRFGNNDVNVGVGINVTSCRLNRTAGAGKSGFSCAPVRTIVDST